MNKHIEEMVTLMCGELKNHKSCKACKSGNPNANAYCRIECYAESLYNAGYRKVSQEGAECPTCRGTGRIGTTDWLTKNISKEQLAKEKAEAVAEHEAQFKCDVAREIFAEIDALCDKYPTIRILGGKTFAELKKKYESEGAE